MGGVAATPGAPLAFGRWLRCVVKVWGEISDANIALSAPAGAILRAPTDEVYYEYSFGIANIFKIIRIDFNFRGNYLDIPDARPFSITGNLEFVF